MNQDIESLNDISNLSRNDFERFKSVLRILTSKTFIIRGIDKERELYDFAIRNISLFEAWFSCMDTSLICDESLGVIAFRGMGNTRLHFSKDEICAVLVLRLLYDEKKLEVSLTRFPVVSVRDFQDKYNAMTGVDVKKNAFDKILRRLKSCKLIFIESTDVTSPDAIIELYPSIPLSIDRSALDEAIELLEKVEDEHIDSTNDNDFDLQENIEADE